MSEPDYRGRRVLVVGLARSGRAAADFLLGRGARVRVTDLRTESELAEDVSMLEKRGVELVLGGHPPGLVEDVDLVVTSPGVPFEAPPLREARARGVPVWGELELGFRHVRGVIVAVTGTKGKSTTVSLVAHILSRAGRKVALAGNIGRPLIGLTEHSGEGAYFVVEVSSFQLETTESFRPRLAVLLDVTPDHLDRHPSFASYAQAKQRIFVNQEAEDWAVVYGGNPLTREMGSRARSRKVYFGFERMEDIATQVFVDGPWIVKHESGRTTALAAVEKIPLRGRHNVENVIAAAAATSILGVDLEILATAVEDFRGVPHALEKVADLDGVAFYNDSKATNVAAARAAIESFTGGVHLILGGRSKAGEFEDLRPQVSRSVKRVLAIGESRDRIVRALGDIVPVVECENLEEAVETAFRHAAAGDTVLLSPACASFDMFVDYADRGERFRDVVEKLRRARQG